MLDTSGIKSKEIAYIGDDLNDIPVFQKVGLAVTPANGSKELDPFINFRTEARGGEGALRELIEIILKSQDHWKNIIKSFMEKNES